eukprot:gene4068-8092_t
MRLYSNRNYWLSTVGWILRTCFSVAVITALCLHDSTQAVFALQTNRLNGLAFASFVCVVVKDSTIGATVTNAWGAIMGGLVSTFCCWSLMIIIGEDYNVYYALSMMFLLSFIIQYVEFHPFGKKLALSLIALNFLQSLRKKPDLDYVWELFRDILFGCACAIIGNLFPWIRSAFTEVEEVAQFNAVSISSLFESLISQWFIIHLINNKNEKSLINKSNPKYTKFVRKELIALLYSNLNDMQSMTGEARLGPKRDHIDLYIRFASLTRQLLVIIEILEIRLENMERMDKFHYILEQFYSYPFFKSSLLTLVNKFSTAIFEITQWIEESSLQPTEKVVIAMNELLEGIRHCEIVYNDARETIYYGTPPTTTSTTPVNSIKTTSANNNISKNDNDNNSNDNNVNCLTISSTTMTTTVPEYKQEQLEEYQCTNTEKVSEIQPIPPLPLPSPLPLSDIQTPSSTIPTSTSTVYLVASSPSTATGTGTGVGMGMGMETRAVATTKARTGTRTRVEPSLSLEMNAFLFLLDAASNLVLQFEPSITSTSTSPQPEIPPSSTRNICTMLYSVSISSYSNYFQRLLADLIPPQRHLFQFTFNLHKLPVVIRRRLRQTFSISISMLLAGIYGYLSHQTDASMAAFTIAYICGGAVAGANIVTAFNRCVGTIVACIVALLVAKIITGWELNDAKWFIGVVIVLAQVPGTYVRSVPKYGYAGLCFGFTVPVLLIPYPQFSADSAAQRIVDTIVGVSIYIGIELCMMKYEFAEDLFLNDTVKVFHGIESHFRTFNESFRTSSVGSHKLNHMKKILEQNNNTNIKLFSTFFIDIRRQKDILQFLHIEPTLWRPLHFPVSMLNELILYEEQAHKSIEIMAWAVAVSLNYSPTYKTSTSTTTYNNNTTTTDDDNDNVEDIENRTTMGNNNNGDEDEFEYAMGFKFLLEPLEKQVLAVEDFVCNASVLLRQGIENLRNNNKSNLTTSRAVSTEDLFHRVTAYQYGDDGNGNNGLVDVIALAMKEDINLFQKYTETAQNLQSSYISTIQIEEYDKITALARKSLSSKSKQKRMIMSNAEVKVVNTALVCLRDLLVALSGMASVIMKMQAYRAVQASENKYFAVLQEEMNVIRSVSRENNNRRSTNHSRNNSVLKTDMSLI